MTVKKQRHDGYVKENWREPMTWFECSELGNLCMRHHAPRRSSGRRAPTRVTSFLQNTWKNTRSRLGATFRQNNILIQNMSKSKSFKIQIDARTPPPTGKQALVPCVQINRLNQCQIYGIWAFLRGQSSFNSRDDTSLLRVDARDSNIGFLQSSTWMQQPIWTRIILPKGYKTLIVPSTKNMKRWWKKMNAQNLKENTDSHPQKETPPEIPLHIHNSPKHRNKKTKTNIKRQQWKAKLLQSYRSRKAPEPLVDRLQGGFIPRQQKQRPWIGCLAGHTGRRTSETATWSCATFLWKKHGWYSMCVI